MKIFKYTTEKYYTVKSQHTNKDSVLNFKFNIFDLVHKIDSTKIRYVTHESERENQ